MKLLLIALGGGIGSVLRYSLSTAIHQLYGGILPAGTLAVNTLGSLGIGLLWGVFERFSFSPNARVFMFVGILGGFTTFSTYSIETINLFEDRQIALVAANVLGTNILCLLLCYAGFIAGNVLANRMR